LNRTGANSVAVGGVRLDRPQSGLRPQTLLEGPKRKEVDGRGRQGVTLAEAKRVKGLGREVKKLRRINEILKLTSRFSPRRISTVGSSMRVFIYKHRRTHGVDPICKVLQIPPASYRRHAAQKHNPDLCCARLQHDDEPQIDPYKGIIGARLRSRSWSAQECEAGIGVAVLNGMIEAGRQSSVRTGGANA
jgi:hypothetical protein